MRLAHIIKSFSGIFIELISAWLGFGYSGDQVDNIPLWVAIITSIIVLLVGGLLVLVAVAYFLN